MNNTEPKFDLNNLSGMNQKYTVNLSNTESPEDGSARRELDAAAATHQRKIQFAIVLFALFIASIIFIGCVVIFATGSADDKKWSAGIITSIASGLIGFLVGQGSKK